MPLGKRSDYGDAKYAGVCVDFAHDITAVMQEYLLCGFDFVVAPLVHPGHRAPPLLAGCELPGTMPGAARQELMLTPASCGSQIVGLTSSWLEPDSEEPLLAARSCEALSQELSWAAFLGLQAVIVPLALAPRSAINQAQVINKALDGLTNMAIWLRVPLAARPADATWPTPAPSPATAGPGTAGTDCTAAGSASAGPVGGGASQAWKGANGPPATVNSPPPDPWERWWQAFSLCGHNNLLGLALEVPTGPLPSAPLVRRWLGQPIKALLLPTAAFSANRRGYPVLPRAHQELLSLFFGHQVQVILTGEPLHRVAPAPPGPPAPPPRVSGGPGTAQQEANQRQQQKEALQSAQEAAGTSSVASDPVLPFTVHDPGESHPLRPYWEYLCYLFRRMEDLSPQELLEVGYRDYLQAPLQPLQDNLESQTYETFEKDTTKYDCYQRAVFRALQDRAKPGGQPTVVMVVGAGRGPLVRASMRAAQEAGVPLRAYALEKNPCAVVHIQSMVAREGWQDQVTIVSADMRTWSAPEQADILVSELLGSFGDNELSPECLDGAQRLLAPDGISIPASYTSYLAPVTSTKLHDAVRAYKDLEHAETPYVVKLHRHAGMDLKGRAGVFLLSPPQPVFTFSHPTKQPADNTRRATLLFPRDAADGAGALHGFAGYFESVLYKEVMLSTHPPTHTPSMFSWFPIYFPLREPMMLPAGTAVTAHMWRLCGKHKVWYEWAVSTPDATPIHNPAGRSYYVGL